jgi:hypothetical protein
MGANYFRKIMDSLATISEQDRTLMSLSGYNIGQGALSRLLRHTAQSIAQEATSTTPSEEAAPSMGAGVNRRLIRLNFPPQVWQQMTWPKVRYTALQLSREGLMSSQPVFLTERVRTFKTVLDKTPPTLTTHSAIQTPTPNKK